ncbi:unnamed protein product, partial [Mesorhabditis spiculigera]
MTQPAEVVNPVEVNPTTGDRIPAFLKNVAPEGHVQWAQTHLIQLFGTFPDSSVATGDGKHGTSGKPMAPTRQRSHPPLRRLSCPNQNRGRPLPVALQNAVRTTSEQNLRIIHEHLATYNSLPIAGKSKMAVDLALEVMERLHAENLNPNYDQLFPEVMHQELGQVREALEFKDRLPLHRHLQAVHWAT